MKDNRNDTVEYWRTRATTAELKIREFAEQLEQLKSAERAGEFRNALEAALLFIESAQDWMHQTKVRPLPEFLASAAVCKTLVSAALERGRKR